MILFLPPTDALSGNACDYRLDGDVCAPNIVLFAHGAGAGMDHPFMAKFAQWLAGEQIAVIRFEFPYMIRARAEGKRLPPERLPKLVACYQAWLNAINAAYPQARVFVAGKSMGGRVATVLAQSEPCAGVLALGYPFHPVGKNALEHWRLDPIEQCAAPLLILQGERDNFGSRQELSALASPEAALLEKVQLHWLPDGDHSLVPRKRSGVSEDDNIQQAAAIARRFILQG